MSGVFSTVVNFTTEQFLKRAGKLSVLADIQNQGESDDDSSCDDETENVSSISAS
ncbi:unnamed protein product, partial [Rotaria sp. Silwood1]